NDTWTFQNGSWTNATRPVAPRSANGDRYSSAMAFDAADGYLLLAAYTNVSGGYDSGKIHTWKFSSGNWTELTSAVLPGWLSNAPVAVYDPDLEQVIVSPVGENSRMPSGAYNTTSAWWGFRDGSWSQLSIPNSVDTLSGADYVPAAAAVVAFGGAPNIVGGIAGDLPRTTWWLQGLVWWSLNLSPSPPGRQDPSVTYDGSDGYLLVFGGVNFSTSGTQLLNDTWAYRPMPGGGSLPSVRIAIAPNRCGPLLWDSTLVANGTTLLTAPGPHVVEAPPCPGNQFDSWNSGGGVRVGEASPNSSVDVESNGSLSLQYVPVYIVNVTVVPAACGSVLVDGSWVANGGAAHVVASQGVPLLAPACGVPEYEFGSWNGTPDVSRILPGPGNSSASLLVTGNGTLVATYDRLPSPANPPDWTLFEELALTLGAGIGIGGLAVWAWRVRPKAPPPPTPDWEASATFE
ncbi:MAG: hypothetical protein ACHQ16_06195, partial [Candidatus Lutacidiplasmatales archaeon]